MLIMDASVSSAKSRRAEATRESQAAALPADAPVSKPVKPLAPQVISCTMEEAPQKPVFVKRDKRETRASDLSGSAESQKRSIEVALSGNHAKKPLCSFEDE
jgi:hypothetical protein